MAIWSFLSLMPSMASLTIIAAVWVATLILAFWSSSITSRVFWMESAFTPLVLRTAKTTRVTNNSRMAILMMYMRPFTLKRFSTVVLLKKWSRPTVIAQQKTDIVLILSMN